MPSPKTQPKTQVFNLTFRIKAEIGKEVHAVNLEEAIQQARQFKLGDVVGLDDAEYLDGEPQVIGVYQVHETL